MISQEVLFNVTGQTLYYDPPEGRPTGVPTVSVYASTNDDQASTVAATTGVCSVDSVNTTISVAANPGDTSFMLTSGAGIVKGRRYLITDTNGEAEWVEVMTVSGGTVKVRQPIQNTYSTSATFQGCRISINVDPTWVATVTNITDVLDPTGRAWLTTHTTIAWVPGAAGYRLRWSYTVGGTPTLGVSFMDLVRYQAKNLVSPLDVDRRFPGWLDRLATDYQEDQGMALIAEAFQAIKMDALGDSQVLRRLRSTEVIRELVIYRANLIAMEASTISGGSNMDALHLARDLYARRYDQLLREPKIPADQMGQGAAMDPVRLAVWRR